MLILRQKSFQFCTPRLKTPQLVLPYCLELWKQGITRDQEVFIDSDGFNHGEKPIKAHCTFPSSNVTFGEEKHINITYCEGADCFQSPDFQIDNSTLNQMQSVIDASTSCSQKWAFNCISAPLKQPVSLHTHINGMQVKFLLSSKVILLRSDDIGSGRTQSSEN